MGNPHAVIFVDKVSDDTGDVLRGWGRALEHHPAFPERMNVHFVQVIDEQTVRVLHWERGSGPTLACGTGACAVCVAGAGSDRRLVELGVELLADVLAVVLAERAGITRADYMKFINMSVMGSTFTKYKTPTIVNLDFTPSFTGHLLRKDFELGLEAGKQLDVPLPGRVPFVPALREGADSGNPTVADDPAGGGQHQVAGAPGHAIRLGPRRRLVSASAIPMASAGASSDERP